MLKRIARTSYRRRWRVLAAWVVLLVGLIVASNAAGGVFRNEFSLNGSESSAAFDLLEEKGFSDRAGFSGQIVFQADQGVDDPQVQAEMERLFTQVENTVPRVEVVSPYSAPRQISEDGRIAYAEVNFADRPDAEFFDAADEIKAEAQDVQIDGVQIELGGELFADFEMPASEAIGILLAIVVLLFAFGSVLAAGLPILTALFGIGTGIALVQLTANGLTMPDFTSQAVAMIGIGVGIDYALLIVTRYRQALRDGHQPESAVVLALDTAGRSVVFAGTTVVIAVLGMLLIDVPAVRGLAIGISLGVLMTMLAAVTLLPAVLGFVGNNIDRFGLRHRKTRRGRRWQRLVLVPVEPGHPAPPVARRDRGNAGAADPRRSRSSRCAWRSPTPGTAPTPRGARTTSWPRASGSASTARSSLPPRPPVARATSPCWRTSRASSRARRASRSSRRRSPTVTTAPRSCRCSRPRHRRRRRRPTSSTRCATTSSRV